MTTDNFYRDDPANEAGTLMQVLTVLFYIAGGVVILFAVTVFKLMSGNNNPSKF